MVWSKHFDPTTRLYYYHDAETQETVWELPTGARVMPFLILKATERKEVPVPFVVPPSPWKGYLNGNTENAQWGANQSTESAGHVAVEKVNEDEDENESAAAMSAEVKQMAMESFLRESGLQVYTPKLLQLGIRNMEDLANPLVMSDADLVKSVGMTMGQVGLFRKETRTVSAHLPSAVRASIMAQPPSSSTTPASSPPTPALKTHLDRSVVRWSGWLEKRGRSAFSKVEKRFFVLREGGPHTSSFEEKAAKKFGEPGYYSLEYFAAPANQKYNVGLDVGEDPLGKGYEQKGCILLEAVTSLKCAQKDKKVSVVTPEKPYDLVSTTEYNASALHQALQDCLDSLKRNSALTLPSPVHPLPAAGAGAAPGADADVASDGGGADDKSALQSFGFAVPPAPSPPPSSSSSGSAAAAPSSAGATPPPSSPEPQAPAPAAVATTTAAPAAAAGGEGEGADRLQASTKDDQFFKSQAEAKRAERDNMLNKMTPEQREAFLKEEQSAKAHDDLKSKHVLKTTRAFGPAGGNPLTSGRGGRGGRGGR